MRIRINRKMLRYKNSNPSAGFVLNLLGIGTAISLLGDATLYAVLPHPAIAAQVGISLSMVGLLLGANRAVRLLLNGPVGVLYDRLPRRGLLVAALSLGAGASVFYALGYGFWPLLVGRILWGLAWSLLWVGGNSVVLDISSEEQRGRNSGIYQMWFLIGVALASLSGTLLTDLFGFRRGQWISVVLIGLSALAWLLFLPETRRSKGDDARQDAGETADLPTLPWRVLLGTSATVFCSRLVTWGVLAATSILWLAQLFADGWHMFGLFVPIATLTGLYIALSKLTGIASARMAGAFSDRWGRRWPVIGLAMGLGGLGLWLMSGEVLWLALMGTLLVPLADGSTETLVPAIAGDRVPSRARSRALGLINTAGDFGATIGPFFALGLLNSGGISLGAIYKIAAILFGVVGLGALMVEKRK
jgi:MFS family permease